MNHGRAESASLLIGKVARRAGVGVETIRFYERQGLLTAPIRKDSGYRLYPEHVLGRIRFIKRAKELGFSLKEIKDSRNSGETLLHPARRFAKKPKRRSRTLREKLPCSENETGA